MAQSLDLRTPMDTKIENRKGIRKWQPRTLDGHASVTLSNLSIPEVRECPSCPGTISFSAPEQMFHFFIEHCWLLASTSATTSLPTSNVSDIIDTIKNTLPDAASTPRIIEAAEEVARANGGELHNISALTGGMVAQEVIKIITRQYIPIDNTCIFDGITSRMQVLRIWPGLEGAMADRRGLWRNEKRASVALATSWLYTTKLEQGPRSENILQTLSLFHGVYMAPGHLNPTVSQEAPQNHFREVHITWASPLCFG
jgi:hypothetical protein